MFSADEMFYADEMDPNLCPRCGNPVTIKPRGRPARWCSDRCRKLASEERRAAERGAIATDVIAMLQDLADKGCLVDAGPH